MYHNLIRKQKIVPSYSNQFLTYMQGTHILSSLTRELLLAVKSLWQISCNEIKVQILIFSV